VGPSRGGAPGIYRGSKALRDALDRGMRNPVDQTERDRVTGRSSNRASQDIPLPPERKKRSDLGGAKVNVEVKGKSQKHAAKDKKFIDASLRQTPQMGENGGEGTSDWNNYAQA
jgi:hypothetical protein